MHSMVSLMTKSRDSTLISTGRVRPRVLLADDNPAILERATTLLEQEFDVLATLPSGEAVLEEYDRLKPDVIVLDISMNGMSGIEVARRLRDKGSSAKIIFLTVHGDSDFVNAALGAGGSAYVVKNCLGADLVSAIHAVLADKLFVSAPLLYHPPS